jgi:hypothetical protein
MWRRCWDVYDGSVWDEEGRIHVSTISHAVGPSPCRYLCPYPCSCSWMLQLSVQFVIVIASVGPVPKGLTSFDKGMLGRRARQSLPRTLFARTQSAIVRIPPRHRGSP